MPEKNDGAWKYDNLEDEEDLDEEDLDEEALTSAASAGEDDDPDIDESGGSLLPDSARGPVPEGPTNADFFAGAAPFMFLHKSHHFVDTQVEALGVAHRVVQGGIGLGAIVRLPKLTQATAARFLASCSQATIKLADPEIFTIETPVREAAAPSTKSVRNHPWASSIPAIAAPPAQRERWVNDVLQAQHDAGANVLLSASGWVSDQQAAASLAAAMNWVDLSRAQLADEHMFVNLTLSSSWLSTPELRAMLLDEIVESDEQNWYLRFHWPIVEPRQGQLSDPAILDGYRDLVATARDEGKIVVFPNSGLTGWLMTALGAAGFSTGVSGSEREFAAQRIASARKGQPKPPERPRYFDRTVLHVVEWPEAQTMSGAAGYLSCTCRYCNTMRAAGWARQLAGGHYLVRTARLSAELVGANPRRAARDLVTAAQTFTASLKGSAAELTGVADPKHLRQWRRVL